MYAFTMNEFTFQMVADDTYAIMGYSGHAAEVTIPAMHGGKPVTVLFDNLFAGHTELEKITIPDSVTNLGEFLFDGCVNLKHIDLPQSITAIWPYAFVRSGIEEIVLPDSMTTVAPFTFKDCKSLRKVVCGAGLTKIGAYAFQGCDALAELQQGPNVEISPKAFAAK